MRELVERGHIYIAQPPLYKTKKGKQEQYLKDDTALKDFTLRVSLDGSTLHPSADAPAISEKAFENVGVLYHQAMDAKIGLMKRYPDQVVQVLTNMPQFPSRGELSSAQDWQEGFLEQLNKLGKPIGERYEATLETDAETNAHSIALTCFAHGAALPTLLKEELWQSADYQALVALYDEATEALEAGAYVQHGDKMQLVENIYDTMGWLTGLAQKSFSLQRYKGLGEMNPEQLWETTMDPQTRTMLQVTIEDAIAADEIFSTLMGDQVDPRRAFIEENALLAENIDV
jgi:DNA gyrase subunit B